MVLRRSTKRIDDMKSVTEEYQNHNNNNNKIMKSILLTESPNKSI